LDRARGSVRRASGFVQISITLVDPDFGEEKAHRVRKSLEEEEQRNQRNLLLSSSGCKSRLTKVEQTGQ
jgi:hypothetical protein